MKRSLKKIAVFEGGCCKIGPRQRKANLLVRVCMNGSRSNEESRGFPPRRRRGRVV